MLGFGKSYTASLFSQWVFGKSTSNQVITASYNEKMSSKFSQTVRDGIGIEGISPTDIAYADIFPDTRVKKGDSAKQSWSLEGYHHNYLATSAKGSLTGMRANVAIIDDLIKDAYESFNERILEEKWEWYTDTFLSRILEGGIQIVIATRWSTKDLTGRLITVNPDNWYILSMPACLNEETHEMLCPELMSWERYAELKELTSEEIFLANYQQQPIEVIGRLYNNLKTYEHIPKDTHGNPLFEEIINYTDTADKGSDYLASIVAGVYDKQLYVLGVYYTQDDMTITEQQTADLMYRNKVNRAIIESNNGGSNFARSVERILKDTYGSRYTTINQFHQSKNKEARILTMSSFVQSNIYFPVDWGRRWTDFYVAINSYQREFKNNKHDDAVDALTGLAEQIENGRKKWKAVPSLY
jgi:predicted phage terminase large subunit-like protein